jgi:hypothetical protein
MTIRPRTDIGTAFLHWSCSGRLSWQQAPGFALPLTTRTRFGFRCSIRSCLPNISGFAILSLASSMTAALAGYGVYVVRARLTARIRFDAARARAIWRGGKAAEASLASSRQFGSCS